MLCESHIININVAFFDNSLSPPNADLIMERIARRKLQKMSGSAYVALPPVWIEEHGLHKGDPIDIFKENGRLIICRG